MGKNGLTRISFDLTDDIYNQIEAICQKENISKAELFRRSVNLYLILRNKFVEENYRLIFENRENNNLIEFIIPFWNPPKK